MKKHALRARRIGSAFHGSAGPKKRPRAGGAKWIHRRSHPGTNDACAVIPGTIRRHGHAAEVPTLIGRMSASITCSGDDNETVIP